MKNQYKFEGPIKVEGTLNKIDVGVQFIGKLYANIKVQCSRCLEEFKLPLEITFDEQFSKYEEEMGYKISENFIDISKLIEDNILLNIPLKPLCSESCKGLCQICGTNLNKSNCTCDTQIVDPRLEKLKNFFNAD